MENFVQATYSGLVLGSIYALMAMGFTLIYGALRFLNLALGALFTLGGYVAWLVTGQWGLAAVLGIVAAFVVVSAIGAASYQTVVRPLIGRPGWDIATIIASLGLGIVIENLILIEFGPRNKSIPLLLEGGFRVGDILRVQYQQLLTIAVSLFILVLMGLFLTRSRHGLAIRAIAQNRDAAYLVGTPVHRVFAIVMGISAGLAAVAGVLLSAVFFLNPSVGLAMGLKGLIVTIFGGLGSIIGTLYAAFLIGLFESYVSMYLGARWSLPALFLFLIAVLIIRPGGIAGLPEEARV
jgi:branched-chain amino acid transport system permease protein